MSGNVVETLIGAVVLVVAGVFLVFAYSTAGVGNFGGGYELTAKFNRADGINIGGDVRISGIKVGRVTEQWLDPESYLAVVRFSIDSSVKLPEDTAAKIASQGLLGDNYLALDPGGSDRMLQDGEEIRFTQSAVNLMDLIGQAIFGGAQGQGGGLQGSQPADQQPGEPPAIPRLLPQQ